MPSSVNWSHRSTEPKQIPQSFPVHCYKQFQRQWQCTRSLLSLQESQIESTVWQVEGLDRLQHPPKFQRDPLSMSCKLQQQMGSILHLHHRQSGTSHINHADHSRSNTRIEARSPSKEAWTAKDEQPLRNKTIKDNTEPQNKKGPF